MRRFIEGVFCFGTISALMYDTWRYLVYLCNRVTDHELIATALYFLILHLLTRWYQNGEK